MWPACKGGPTRREGEAEPHDRNGHDLYSEGEEVGPHDGSGHDPYSKEAGPHDRNGHDLYEVDKCRASRRERKRPI